VHLSWNEMFEKFRFGSYRIDDSELANSKKNNLKLNSVLVNCLDGSKLTFQIDVSVRKIPQLFFNPKNILNKKKIFFSYRKKLKAVNY